MIFYNPKPRTALALLTCSFAKVVVTEYKFWVDFQGLMYFDDAQVHHNPRNQIRDLKFIDKFYHSLRENDGEQAEKYRYVGEFWGEKNYLRFSTAPIIYTALHEGELEFSLGLRVPFHPSNLYLDANGHFCYPFTSAHTTLKGIFSNRLSASLLADVR